MKNCAQLFVYLLILVPLFSTSRLASAAPEKQPTFRDGSSPCQPFRLACMAAGFSLTSQIKGNRLIANCILPLVKGEPVVSVTTGEPVAVPTGADASACRANIHEGPGQPTTGIASKSTRAKKP